MKKKLFSLFMLVAAMTATGTSAVAKDVAKDGLMVRFYENTIELRAEGLAGATLFNDRGVFINRMEGERVRFVVEQGRYLVWAEVNGETVVRWVVVK